MRKVEFRIWIPAKESKAHWSEDFPGIGLFHQWANAYEEFESGAGNYTVALVELADGTIREVLPSHLRFKDAL